MRRLSVAGNGIVSNTTWLVACKIAEAALRMVVGMLSARYLGPSNYGLINYAASLVAFFVPIMRLGLQATLVQEYVDRKNADGVIIGTSMAMNTVSAVACVVGVCSVSMLTNWGETDTILICALYSVSLLFQGLEMLQYWFHAKLLSKYYAVAMLIAYTVMSCYKLGLLILGKNVYWFALSVAVEYAVAGILLLVFCQKVGRHRIRIDVSLAKELFSKSRYYVIAMLMTVVYCNISHILLKLMASETENGYFATAMSCAHISGFVFNAIIDTARPVVLKSLHRSQNAFETNVLRTYHIILLLSVAQALLFTFFSWLIIPLLYGEAYRPAIPILQILAWQVPFVHVEAIRNIWFLGKQKHSIVGVINTIGATLSVVLNLVLIPQWGACGAALATTVSQAFVSVGIGVFLKPVRENNCLIIKSLHPRCWKDMFYMFLSNCK
jgi:O-antigen/teichoic acid export membrane protein